MNPKPVIFLDLDGVLNHAEYWKTYTGLTVLDAPFDPECVSRLNQLIRDSDGEVVITSSWRHFKLGTKRIEEYMNNAGFAGTVIGETPVLHVPLRGMEVQRWLMDNPGRRKIVIIDDGEKYGWLEPYRVKVNPEVGLQAEDIADALRILNHPPAAGTWGGL
jgi:hypothetical protein